MKSKLVFIDSMDIELKIATLSRPAATFLAAVRQEMIPHSELWQHALS
jgi:hypothetical protein